MSVLLAPTALLLALIGFTVVLIAVMVLRPSVAEIQHRRVIAFLTLFILPVLCGAWGVSAHLEHSKQTQFCLSCHIMEPYGRSLQVDDSHYLPAQHFQNHRIPADEACYSCHTEYTMFGGLRSKLRGLRHVYAYYIGTPMNPLHLYQPYNNRECLNCHAGARSYVDDPTHSAMAGELKSNQISCLTGGCHDVVHNTAQLQNVKFWRPGE